MLPACLVKVSAIVQPSIGVFCSHFSPYLHYKQHFSHCWFFIFYYLEGGNPRKLSELASCCGAADVSGRESLSWKLESWFACNSTLVQFAYSVNVICLIYVVIAEYLHYWLLLLLFCWISQANSVELRKYVFPCCAVVACVCLQQTFSCSSLCLTALLRTSKFS